MRSTWLARHYAPYSTPVAPLFHVAERWNGLHDDAAMFMDLATAFANANDRLRLDKGTVALIAAHLGWSVGRAEQAADEADRAGAMRWLGEALMMGDSDHFERDGRWF